MRLLFFRLGDFYELFFDDAVTAARELEITLTARNKEKGQAIPMCGVPYHAAEGYIARLIQKGYRVAICDQMEAPSAAKKLVRREITRIVTPGTATEPALLRSHENNYLAAVAPARRARRSGSRRHLHRRIPHHRNGCRRSRRRAGEPERPRSPDPRKTRRPSRLAHDAGGLGLRLRLRRRRACAIISACSRWKVAASRSSVGRRRRRRRSALPARHPEIRARSSGAPHLVRPRRIHGARRLHRPQSGIAGAAVRRREA